MLKINHQFPASGVLPEDYQEVLSWKVTGKPMRVIALNIFGVLLFIVFGMIFSSLAISLGKLPSGGNFRLGLGEISLAIAGILLTFVLHELTHGLVMQLFGASPKYGIIWKGPMLYATSPGYAYRRNNYVVIALAPFIFISTLVVLGMWMAGNSMGSFIRYLRHRQRERSCRRYVDGHNCTSVCSLGLCHG